MTIQKLVAGSAGEEGVSRGSDVASSVNDLIDHAVYGLKAIPDIINAQIHYDALMGTGPVSGQTFANSAFTSSAPASLGDSLLSITNLSSGIVAGQLVSVLCSDGEYYSHLVTSVSGGDVGISPPLRAPVSSGSACIASFYKDQYHPTDYGYRAIADNILRKKLRAEEFSGVFFLNKNVNSSTITTNSANTQANIGSSVVVAKDVTTSTVATQGILFTLTVKDAGYYEAKVQTKSDSLVSVFVLINNSQLFQVDIPAGYCGVTAIPFTTRRQAEKVAIRVCASVASATVTVNERVEYYKITNQSASSLAEFNIGRHLLLGDSWFGQLILAERLAERMPNAEFTNKGVGGRKATDILAAFDADAVGEFDFIWLVCGTNDYVSAVTLDSYTVAVSRIKNKVYSKGASFVFLGSSVGAAYLSASEFNLSRQYGKLTEVNNQAPLQEFVVSVPSITVAAGQTAYLAEMGYFDPEITITGYYFSGAGVSVRHKSTINGGGSQIIAIADNTLNTTSATYTIGAARMVDIYANNASGSPITYHGYLTYVK